MKHLILTVILVCITLQTNAQQSLSYAYDAAGNRIGRAIVLETRASKALQNQTDSISFHEMLAEKQLKIYPNPVLSELTLSITGYQSSMSGEFSILTLGGALLKKGKIQSEKTTINMGGYRPGTYILHIQLNGQPTSWKIIKQ